MIPPPPFQPGDKKTFPVFGFADPEFLWYAPTFDNTKFPNELLNVSKPAIEIFNFNWIGDSRFNSETLNSIHNQFECSKAFSKDNAITMIYKEFLQQPVTKTSVSVDLILNGYHSNNPKKPMGYNGVYPKNPILYKTKTGTQFKQSDIPFIGSNKISSTTSLPIDYNSTIKKNISHLLSIGTTVQSILPKAMIPRVNPGHISGLAKGYYQVNATLVRPHTKYQQDGISSYLIAQINNPIFYFNPLQFRGNSNWIIGPESNIETLIRDTTTSSNCISTLFKNWTFGSNITSEMANFVHPGGTFSVNSSMFEVTKNNGETVEVNDMKIFCIPPLCNVYAPTGSFRKQTSSLGCCYTRDKAFCDISNIPINSSPLSGTIQYEPNFSNIGFNFPGYVGSTISANNKVIQDLLLMTDQVIGVHKGTHENTSSDGHLISSASSSCREGEIGISSDSNSNYLVTDTRLGSVPRSGKIDLSDDPNSNESLTQSVGMKRGISFAIPNVDLIDNLVKSKISTKNSNQSSLQQLFTSIIATPLQLYGKLNKRDNAWGDTTPIYNDGSGSGDKDAAYIFCNNNWWGSFRDSDPRPNNYPLQDYKNTTAILALALDGNLPPETISGLGFNLGDPSKGWKFGMSNDPPGVNNVQRTDAHFYYGPTRADSINPADYLSTYYVTPPELNSTLFNNSFFPSPWYFWSNLVTTSPFEDLNKSSQSITYYDSWGVNMNSTTSETVLYNPEVLYCNWEMIRKKAKFLTFSAGGGRNGKFYF